MKLQKDVNSSRVDANGVDNNEYLVKKLVDFVRSKIDKYLEAKDLKFGED
jgi:hypothetical protein